MADQAPLPITEVSGKARLKYIFSETWPFFFSLLTPLVLMLIFLWKPDQKYEKAPFALFLTLLMACYWVSECIPLAITSLIPVVLVPLFGIADSDEICGEYFNQTVMFLFGGCVVAIAFEYSDLHTRISYLVMKNVGAQPSMLLFGMMMTCMVLSCWMNNTSTTAMMVPIIFSIMDQYEKRLIPTETPEELAEQYIETFTVNKLPDAVSIGKSKSEIFKPAKVEAGASDDVRSGKSVTNTHAPPNLNQMGPTGTDDTAPAADTLETKSSVSVLMEPRQEEESSVFIGSASMAKISHWEGVIASKRKYVRGLEIMFLMGVAVASNIGGTGVITGTGTNLIAARELNAKFLEGREKSSASGAVVDPEKCFFDDKTSSDYWNLDFVRWILLNFIGMVINVFVSWIFLAIFYQGMPRVVKQFYRKNIRRLPVIPLEVKEAEDLKRAAHEIKNNINERYKALGPTTFHQWMIIILFLILVCFWILRNPAFGRGSPVKYDNPYNYSNDTQKILNPVCILPGSHNSKSRSTWGWARFFGDDCNESFIHDYVATLFVCVLFFSLPKDLKYYKNALRGGIGEGMDDPLLPFDYVCKNIPWGPLFMLGGGFGISKAIAKSRLGDFLQEKLTGNPTLESLNTQSLFGLSLFVVSIVTTIASNTATAVIVSPILIALAQAKGLPPLYLVVPPIVGASYAFCLPISTPPNAIVYDKAKMKQMDMFVPGLFLTFICNAVLFFVTITYTHKILNVDEYPGSCNLTKNPSTSTRSLNARFLSESEPGARRDPWDF